MSVATEQRKLDALDKVTHYLCVAGLSHDGAMECADALLDLTRAVIDEEREYREAK